MRMIRNWTGKGLSTRLKYIIIHYDSLFASLSWIRDDVNVCAFPTGSSSSSHSAEEKFDCETSSFRTFRTFEKRDMFFFAKREDLTIPISYTRIQSLRHSFGFGKCWRSIIYPESISSGWVSYGRHDKMLSLLLWKLSGPSNKETMNFRHTQKRGEASPNLSPEIEMAKVQLFFSV